MFGQCHVGLTLVENSGSRRRGTIKNQSRRTGYFTAVFILTTAAPKAINKCSVWQAATGTLLTTADFPHSVLYISLPEQREQTKSGHQSEMDNVISPSRLPRFGFPRLDLTLSTWRWMSLETKQKASSTWFADAVNSLCRNKEGMRSKTKSCYLTENCYYQSRGTGYCTVPKFYRRHENLEYNSWECNGTGRSD